MPVAEDEPEDPGEDPEAEPDEPDEPDEPGRGSSPLRAFLAMLIIGGLFATGIWFYLRGSESDLKLREQIFASLELIGSEIWSTGGSMSLGVDPEDGEARLDLEDLPRIIAALRGASKGVPPKIQSLEGDPPPGNERASHQILFSYNTHVQLVIRVRYDDKTGIFTFIGVANRIVPSRKVLLESQPPAPPPVPGEQLEEKVSESPANPP